MSPRLPNRFACALLQQRSVHCRYGCSGAGRIPRSAISAGPSAREERRDFGSLVSMPVKTCFASSLASASLRKLTRSDPHEELVLVLLKIAGLQ